MNSKELKELWYSMRKFIIEEGDNLWNTKESEHVHATLCIIADLQNQREEREAGQE